MTKRLKVASRDYTASIQLHWGMHPLWERHDSLFNSGDHCRGMTALSTAEDMSLKGSFMGKISGSQDCMPSGA